MHRLNLPVVVLFGILLLSGSLYARSRVGTIFLNTGEKYVDVTYKIDMTYKVVKMSNIGVMKTKKNVSLTKIAQILDTDGKDVTADRLGKYYRGAPSANTKYVDVTNGPDETTKQAEEAAKLPEPATPISTDDEKVVEEGGTDVTEKLDQKPNSDEAEVSRPNNSEPTDATPSKPSADKKSKTWLSKNDKFLRKSEKKFWSAGLRIGGNFGIPMGDYYEGVTSGPGFEGDIIVPLSKNTALRFSASRSGIDWQDDFKHLTGSDGTFLVNIENSITANRFSAAGQRYYQSRSDGVPGRTITYFFAGLGVISHKFTQTVTIEEIASGLTATATADTTVTKFMFTIGGGITALLSPKLGVDFGSQLDMISVGSTEERDFLGRTAVQYAFVFDINLGLIYLF